MPLYDYHCAACDAGFEDFRPADETEHPACPTCGKPSRRCPSATHYKTNPFPYKDALKKHSGPVTMPRMGKPGGCGGSGGFS